MKKVKCHKKRNEIEDLKYSIKGVQEQKLNKEFKLRNKIKDKRRLDRGRQPLVDEE